MGVTYPGTQTTGPHFVGGQMVICTEGSLHVNGPMRIAPGAAANLVLTSDAAGNVSWASPVRPLLTSTPVVSFTPPGPTTVQAALGEFIPVDTTAGPVTVTLPPTPTQSGGLAIKQVATAPGNTTTIALGDINDVINENQQTLTLTLENEGVLLWWSPTEISWFAVAADLPLYGLDLRYLSMAGGSLTGGLTAESVSASGLTGAVQATRYAGGTGGGAPIAGVFAKGDWIIDQTGALWICTTAGNPGVWVSAAVAAVGVAMLTGAAFTGDVTVPTIAASTTGATAASRYAGATASGAPVSGTFVNGDFVIDHTGKVWICTDGATRTFTQAGTGSYLPLNGGSILGGSLGIGTAGQGLIVSEGANGKQGTAMLGTDDPPVPGEVTVANTSVTANSRIFLTVQSPGGGASVTGSVYVSTRVAGVSFTIKSTNVAVDATADTSIVAYEIFEPWSA
jgi:hypothetical protein